MPTFDYRCKNLNCFSYGEVKEHLVKNYKDKVKCIACDDDKEKLVSAPNLGNMNKQGSSTTL